MKVRGALADLLWRIMAPALAEAWGAGYKAGARDADLAYWGPCGERAQNPYRREDDKQ